jgi:hypothetical protein
MTESERTVYLVELGCNHCGETTTFATKGPAVGVDRDAPWPAVDHCPLCAASYPDDLGWVIQSVHEAEIDDEPEVMTDGGPEQTGTEQLTSEMTPEDWQDVAESEFVDFTESAMGTKLGFVFDHPEIGLHGFQYVKNSGHIRPCSFEVSSDD